jgi:glycerol-3-phosphate O-acyltransferase / dihydroxyacetone phosphate acyltransferase
MNAPAALSDQISSAEKVNLGYRLVKRFVSFWVNRFFRNVQINRSSDVEKGPVIFAMNHPNNLIDTLLVGFAIKRKIHYLATAQLFRNNIISIFLHSMGIIPVYRKQDDPSRADKNVVTFQECYRVLGNGGAIGIYPEGITHSEQRVKRIKTGAARIALEAENLSHPGVLLVPIGLNYSIRKSFRSVVILNIGKPIQASAYLAQYQTDPGTAIDQLTSDLQEAMENQVVHVETPDLERLLKNVERMYKAELIGDLVEEGISRKEVDSFRLSKKLVEAIEYFNHQDPMRLRSFQEELNTYQSRLKKLHLQDETLRRLVENKTSYRNFLTRVVLLLIGIPFAVWGSVNHFFPYHISRWISQRIAKKETDYATVRILCGMILYPAFYAVQIYWTLKHFGWTRALLYGITLPVFGAFAYYYWDKFRAFRVSLQLFFVMLTRKQLITQMKERREKLIDTLDRAKMEYLNAQIQN